MPKKKAASESDTSDSGPDDVAPKKKSKPNNAAKTKLNDGDLAEWAIDKRKFIRLREFKGKHYVDIREYYQDNNGDMKPTKKGVSLTIDQWRAVEKLIPDIDGAIKEHV